MAASEELARTIAANVAANVAAEERKRKAPGRPSMTLAEISLFARACAQEEARLRERYARQSLRADTLFALRGNRL